jgi:hypothetical protein
LLAAIQFISQGKGWVGGWMAGAGARKMEKRVGRYEEGQTISHRTFVKVKLAVDSRTTA